MPFIVDNSNVTISAGDLEIGAVEIKDHDSDLRAEVTVAGLAVDVNELSLIGDCVRCTIDSGERRLDLTPLVAGGGYPMVVELEARDSPVFLRQGNAAIVLNTTSGLNYRLQADDWRLCTVSGVAEAYLATERERTSVSGTLVACRGDTVL